MLPIRLAESVAFARAYSHHRRPPAAGLRSLSAQKRVPIQNRMRTRILIDNHLFCVHCCAVYTLSGNGGRPAPVTWNVPFTCTTSEGSSFCTSQHRAHTAPGSLRPSHAEYCLRQCLSLYVPQYSPPRPACQEDFSTNRIRKQIKLRKRPDLLNSFDASRPVLLSVEGGNQRNAYCDIIAATGLRKRAEIL